MVDYGFGYRHLQVLLLFTGLMIAYALRVNLSLGIVAMVDNSENPEFIVSDIDYVVKLLCFQYRIE